MRDESILLIAAAFVLGTIGGVAVAIIQQWLERRRFIRHMRADTARIVEADIHAKRTAFQRKRELRAIAGGKPECEIVTLHNDGPRAA